MTRRRYLSISQKARELVGILGSRGEVVRIMRCASKTSLKRWISNRCQPLRAHALAVSDLYNKRRELQALVDGLRREVEMKLRMERLAQSVKQNQKNRLENEDFGEMFEKVARKLGMKVVVVNSAEALENRSKRKKKNSRRK